MTETRTEYETEQGDRPPLGTLLVGWSGDTSLDDARAGFVARFGHEPEWIIRYDGAVLAGPVRESDA